MLTAGSCPVPGYLPDCVRPVLPWARRHVAMVAERYHLGTDDLWDEVITALLRVSLYSEPWEHTEKRVGFRGVHDQYAKTAIHRACWRYVVRRAEKRPRLLTIGEDIDLDLEQAWHSAEEEVMAREAVRRAWLLREHAALASARGDTDTTTRLRGAATAAATVARAARRRPRIARA